MRRAARPRREHRRAFGLLALVVASRAPVGAAAQAAADPAPPAVASQSGDGAGDAEGAERSRVPCGSHCWNMAFLSSGEDTRLGLQLASTWLGTPDDARATVGLLTSYFAQAYRTDGVLGSHAQLYGAIGAGSAGTEGEASGALDFGVHLPVSRRARVVARVGPSGELLGHDELERSLLEPLRLRAGLLHSTDTTRVESGLTTSVLAAGRARVADAARGLAGSLALGAYLSGRVPGVRVDAALGVLRRGPLGGGARLASLSLSVCVELGAVVLCADVDAMRARLLRRSSDPPMVSASRFGLTAALGP